MNNREIFEAYLNAVLSGDHETAAQYLADDFTFKGPMMAANSKQEFFANLSPQLAAMTRGSNILQQFEKGDELCTIYEFNIETPVGKGAVYMVEWVKVRDGQLISARLVFDTAEFGALMPG